MKKLLFLFTLLFAIHSFSQDKIDFKKYSYSEFFKMIENEPSDTFTLKNAAIVFDSITDMAHATLRNEKELLRKDTITINKKLVLENIFFSRNPLEQRSRKYREQLYFIKFQKQVGFTNCLASINHCLFQDRVSIRFNNELENMYKSYFNQSFNMSFGLANSSIKKGIYFNSSSSFGATEDNIITAQFGIENCEIWPYINKRSNRSSGSIFFIDNLSNFFIVNSIFYGENKIGIYNGGGHRLNINSNDFKNNFLELSFSEDKEQKNLSFTSNIINKPTQLALGYLKSENNLDFKQFKKGIYDQEAIYEYIRVAYNESFGNNYSLQVKDSVRNDYMKNGRHRLAYTFKEETKLLGKLKSHYNSQHDKEYENAVFMEIKNLETQRLQYLYEQNPSFDRYFKWKVNQFLKVFSAYGTEPSKAITFSVYVILLFALIYLFFPNHWDSHGKNRLKHRFKFFYKYTSRNAGIQEVYLEEHKNEIENNEAFRSLLISHKEKAPKLFFNLAMPLYKWSVAGTSIYGWLIKRFDILKGTWQDTEPKARALKSIIIGTIFILALVYDILIKILNALMLSINTFTTLGFGEIPIKGLPRYLAIIQGFIGWFMLTIFSVSLISQLLN